MLTHTWDILCDSAVFVLVGFFIAGVLDIVMSGGWVTRFLSGAKARSVVLATLIGVPLPLCSCSVLPTAITLRKQGASRGATLSFLISTPETSVTSVFLTYALLGPVMAIVRPIAACITAIAAGLAENAVSRRFGAAPEADATPADSTTEAAAPAGESDCCCSCSGETSPDEQKPARSRFGKAMRFAFVDLFDDIIGWVLLGVVVAAALQTWLPPEVLTRFLGGSLQSMLIMVLIGIPLYVCAEASTPIAAVLIMQGLNPGAALVLLLVGPATNIGSLGVLHRHLGRRTVGIYLATIIVVALAVGCALNAALAGADFRLADHVMHEPLAPQWLKTGGAVVMLLLAAVSLWRRTMPRVVGWFGEKQPA